MASRLGQFIIYSDYLRMCNVTVLYVSLFCYVQQNGRIMKYFSFLFDVCLCCLVVFLNDRGPVNKPCCRVVGE